jgi:hypothetical protein
VIDHRAPKDTISRDELIETSERLLGAAPFELVERFEILPVTALDLEWEIATHVVEPASGRIAVGADGRKVGAFILHGGMGDHREKLSMARFLASRFGYRVSLMSYPGRFYLPDPDGRWPGDTIEADGTLRIPIWHRAQAIDHDQYEVVTDRSDPVKRAKWGTLTFAAAKPGTEYHDRLAAWPAAFEAGMRAVCARDFPEGEFSVYVHGHSTGGPFAHMILQRIPNVAGLIGAETSSFSHIFRAGIGIEWTHPFNYLAIMGWRNIAMYRGPEAGPDLQWQLPLVMEDVLDEWADSRHEPYFKAEYIFTYAALPQLERYKGYTHELSGPGVRPVPPLLLTIVKGSRDHTPERYREVVLPMLAAMSPTPKVHLLQIGAGVHGYDSALPDLPMGAFPAIAQAWDDAIRGGFYLTER